MPSFNDALADLQYAIYELSVITGRILDDGQLSELRRCAGKLESIIRSVENGPIPRSFKPLDPDSDQTSF